MASLPTCSKEWIIRQYDHEVQGQTIGKPLQGPLSGPADACVIWPVTATGDATVAGVAAANALGWDAADPHAMAVALVDEALRNLAAAGADTRRAALLDNFCWGDTNDPAQLGSLVRAAVGCRDAALGYGVPFISGKDSLHNTFIGEDRKRHSIPGTLLISAIAPVPDVHKRMTMDLKAPGNEVWLVAPQAEGMAGARRTLDAMFQAIQSGRVLACHDLSEGGLAVAAAEMGFSAGIGLDLTSDEPLFEEAPTRFLIEAAPGSAKAFERLFRGCRFVLLGTTIGEPVLRLRAHGKIAIEEDLAGLRRAWAATLPKLLDAAPVPDRVLSGVEA